MASPIVRMLDDHALIAVDGGLLIAIWWRFPTVAHVEAMRAACTEIVVAHPRFATAVVVMDKEGIFTFSEDVRRAFTDYVRETEASSLATAFVILRRGFVGATIRAFISGLFLIARSKEPHKVFSTTGAAAAWLGLHYDALGPTERRSAGDLQRVLDEAVAEVQHLGV